MDERSRASPSIYKIKTLLLTRQPRKAKRGSFVKLEIGCSLNDQLTGKCFLFLTQLAFIILSKTLLFRYYLPCTF